MFLVVAAIGVFVLGIGIVISVNEIIKAKESSQWPVTDGVIVTSRVSTKESSGGRGGKSTTYTPIVEYKYSVNGQNHELGRMSFRHGYGKIYAKRVVRKFSRGKKIEVAYQQSNPNNSIVKQGIALKLRYPPILIPIGWLIFNFAICFYLIFWMMFSEEGRRESKLGVTQAELGNKGI